MELKEGTKVKMSDTCKRSLIANGCEEHVKEFGDCEGVVIGPTFPGNIQFPDVDVRWFPSMLRYSYSSLIDLVAI